MQEDAHHKFSDLCPWISVSHELQYACTYRVMNQCYVTLLCWSQASKFCFRTASTAESMAALIHENASKLKTHVPQQPHGPSLPQGKLREHAGSSFSSSLTAP